MVQATISWTINVTNTGVAHDLICGCSLLDPNTGETLVDLPWWVIWDVPTGHGWNVPLQATGDIPAGTYTAIARAWGSYSVGTWLFDLEVSSVKVGSVYASGTGALTGVLDESTQTLVISGIPGEVAATINDFSISV